MSNPSPQSEAARWLRYAREDLQAAQVGLTNRRLVPRHSCLFAQQAAEKAIKAGLVLLQINFPKTHVLDALRNMLPPDWVIHHECQIWQTSPNGLWNPATRAHGPKAVPPRLPRWRPKPPE